MARPRTPLLNRSLIRDTTLALVDEYGLAAVSMRRIAAELDVRAPSLYSHYANKDELFDDIADGIAATVDVSGFEGEDWQEGLRIWARSYRAALAVHPNLVPFLASSPRQRPTALHHADAVHGGLTRAGWPPRAATLIGASIKYIVIGSAITSFAGSFDHHAETYSTRYPHLSQAHRLREYAAEIDVDSFELLLESFLRGLEDEYPGMPEIPAHG
ncbi:TetR/AcrR family transcriptional regulator [Rhodococcus sp. (in: high G+C Gram-positive bacteria)]|jgi:AcrR family transcriptional regulator|uniref:TetR/AcrR family transcriptional regulator n=1 Tax=unclassified Rhodococcus (in: high G+C Gram-positive bacteria) TaxID=192944 RepID=UPI0019FC4FAF|nr:TetR/AcrR family transcriptional regulator [Rhodococcus sp. (in: high G+C Gram-positive bacteria)]MBF0663367.1 TetR/AcrR family transcriptional regulator C-terminal domain-containing protein [Rhodococcus sp. (in: high G+C Gram-positive bacteria)]